MKDIHIGAHINTRSLVFTNPIAKYITVLTDKLIDKIDISMQFNGTESQGHKNRTLNLFIKSHLVVHMIIVHNFDYSLFYTVMCVQTP